MGCSAVAGIIDFRHGGIYKTSWDGWVEGLRFRFRVGMFTHTLLYCNSAHESDHVGTFATPQKGWTVLGFGVSRLQVMDHREEDRAFRGRISIFSVLGSNIPQLR